MGSESALTQTKMTPIGLLKREPHVNILRYFFILSVLSGMRDVALIFDTGKAHLIPVYRIGSNQFS